MDDVTPIQPSSPDRDVHHKKKKHKHQKRSKKGHKRRRHDSSSSESEDSVTKQRPRRHDSPENRDHELQDGVHIPSGEREDMQLTESKQAPALETSAETFVRIAESTTVSKLDFFEILRRKEARTDPIGTVHALGRKDAAAGPSGTNKGDWTCPKCSTSNFKNSNQCSKCHALKRLSQYR